jgi:hypothetical protein
MRQRKPSRSMTISEGDALITVLMTTASSAKSIGKAMPFGGYEEVVSPTSQIEMPIPSSKSRCMPPIPRYRLSENGAQL